MPEIAYKRKLAFSTIEKHLRQLLEDGRIALEELLDKDRIAQIKKAVSEVNASLGSIKSRLPKEVSYGEIRYVLTSMGWKKRKQAPIRTAINTYMGNYCFRKCFGHNDILWKCKEKFDKIEKIFGDIQITFREFREMIDNDDIKICKLPLEKRRMYVSWKHFEYLKNKNV